MTTIPPVEGAAARLVELTGSRDTHGAVALASALAEHELAIEQAGIYCRETGVSFPDYRARAKALILEWPSEAGALHATTSLAVRKASETAPEALVLASLLAVMGPAPVPLEVFHKDFIAAVDRDRAFAELARYSVVDLESSSGGQDAILVAPTVQQLMREQLALRDAVDAGVTGALLLLARACPRVDEDKTHDRMTALEPHVRSLLESKPLSLAGVADHGWVNHRVTELQRRLEQHVEETKALKLFDAIFSENNYERDIEAARLVADNLHRYKRDFQLRTFRRAFEYPDNPAMRPIRDVLETYPPDFRNEVLGMVHDSANLIDTLRSLLVADDRDETARFVMEHLEEFPIDLQFDLEGAFKAREETKSFVKRVADLQHSGECELRVRKALGIEQLVAALPKSPPRKQGFWKSFLSGGAGKSRRGR